GGGREIPGDGVEQGGFAGAVGADQCAALARRDRERDVLDRLERTERPGDAREHEGGTRGGRATGERTTGGGLLPCHLDLIGGERPRSSPKPPYRIAQSRAFVSTAPSWSVCVRFPLLLPAFLLRAVGDVAGGETHLVDAVFGHAETLVDARHHLDDLVVEPAVGGLGDLGDERGADGLAVLVQGHLTGRGLELQVLQRLAVLGLAAGEVTLHRVEPVQARL